MPFYGISYSRVVDYENGPSTVDFIRIIENSGASVARVDAKLRAELQKFIDQWNDVQCGAPWAESKSKYEAALLKLHEAVKASKEDRAFLTGETLKAYEADRLAEQDVIRAEIERLRLIYVGEEKAARQALLTGHIVHQEYDTKGVLTNEWTGTHVYDYAEWRYIPDFGDMRFEHLLGNLRSHSSTRQNIISMPSFDIISGDAALSILSKQDSPISVY